MNSDKKAKELLADSYINSVRRIQWAIQDGPTGRTLSELQSSPHFPGEVVGLCGQGGGHPYFRIPVDVLDATLKRIANVDELVIASLVDEAIEEISATCRDLRQQTYFDSGTGCVNDVQPSLVPLLPPAEIWLDGRELPMDVWRLVCFEFDLVSSSVSSLLSVNDFAFSAVNPSALAFRFLLNQLGGRRATFEVELDKVPTAWVPPGANPIVMDVSLARVFFEAGGLLTPLANEDFIKWYGAVRYLHWIDGGSPELRVKDEFNKNTIDCRYRGLFAEETAIGLMAIILGDVFGARPINNTVEVVPPGSLDPGQPVADFIAQATHPTNSQKTTIIAESKGSLGNVVNQARRERAKLQLAATKKAVFTGSNQILPLTLGSTIRFSKQKSRSRCIVTDPPAEVGPDPINVDPVDAWRVAYAKTLKFVGLETAADQVYRGAPAVALHPVDFDRQRDRKRNERDRQRLRRASSARQRFGMELVLDVGQYAFGLDAGVLSVLQRGIDREAISALADILDSPGEFTHMTARGDSFRTSLGVGCISYADLDGDAGREVTRR
jgi:hypothetical protein